VYDRSITGSNPLHVLARFGQLGFMWLYPLKNRFLEGYLGLWFFSLSFSMLCFP